jgi:long-chain acyl-CoA synthetase
MLLLNEILENSIKTHPNKIALQMKMGYRTYKFTYAQIYELAYKTALFLKDNGVKKNDKIILCAPNSPYWIIIFWACLLIGAIPVPLNIQSPGSQIQKVIDQTEAKIIFKHMLFKNELHGTHKMFNIEHLESLVENYDPKTFQQEISSQDDLVEILYTSGTTGDPKGVMLTHKNISSNLQELIKLIHVNLKNDKMLSILPLSHIFEQTIGFLLPYSQGVEIIYAHSHSAIPELLKKYRITKMISVPEFLQIFMSRIENRLTDSKIKYIYKPILKLSEKINNLKFSRLIAKPILKNLGMLDTIACGGAYLDPKLEKKWQNLGIRILQGYGLTETSPAVSTNTFETHRLGSSGKVLPNVQVKIADDKEILVKGPNVFKGYYKNELHTAQAFTDSNNERGWFKTGDLGEFDNDEFLYIKGRKKYMILSSGGQNVYPEDIESELNKLNEVQDSCVIGLSKPNGQVEIHAAILLKPNIKTEISNIIKKANSNLASYQKITGWSIWPELDFPRTVTRKVKKNDVIDWIKSNKDEICKPETKRDKLTTLLSKITNISPEKIYPDTKIVHDLHLDSLMRVELTIWIEQEFNTSISESDINEETTVEDLSKIIELKKHSPQKPKLKKWPRYKIIKIIRSLLQPIIFLIAKIFIKLDVQGLHHIENIKMPAFFMPNHVSYIDGLALEMAIPKRIRKMLSFAAARDVLYEQYWYISWLFELLFNSFALQRGKQADIKSGLESIGTMLDDNYSVVLFPEGRMSRSGQLQEIKGGAALLAIEMGVPVIPILLRGTQNIFPYDSIIPKKIRGRVTIKFGKPLIFKKTDSYEYASQMIFASLKELQDQI